MWKYNLSTNFLNKLIIETLKILTSIRTNHKHNPRKKEWVAREFFSRSCTFTQNPFIFELMPGFTFILHLIWINWVPKVVFLSHWISKLVIFPVQLLSIHWRGWGSLGSPSLTATPSLNELIRAYFNSAPWDLVVLCQVSQRDSFLLRKKSGSTYSTVFCHLQCHVWIVQATGNP